MSAFIVNEYHIARLVEYGERKGLRYYWKETSTPMNGNGQTIFSKLVIANYASVNHRYEENTPPMPGKYECDFDCVLSPVQVIKACDCFDYQSCEVEEYKDTEAANIINAIRDRAISSLPGYEDAEWEIKERPINQKIVRLI